MTLSFSRTYAAPAQVGDKIRLVQMGNDPNPVPAGATGTVTGLCHFHRNEWQVWVKWDAPHADRGLNLVTPEDSFTIIKE